MLKSYTTPYIEEITAFSSGGLRGAEGRRVFTNLHGKTLTFDNPSGSVTFSDPQGAGLRIQDLNTQIRAVPALAGVGVRLIANQLWLLEDAPVSPIHLSTNEEARSILGLPRSGDIQGTLLSPKGSRAAGHILDIYFQNEKFIVLYDDAYNPAGLGAATSSTTVAHPSGGDTDLTATPSSYIYIGGDGDMDVHLVKNPPGDITPYKNLKAGDVLGISVDTIYSTSTVTDLVVHHLGDVDLADPRKHGIHRDPDPSQQPVLPLRLRDLVRNGADRGVPVIRT